MTDNAYDEWWKKIENHYEYEIRVRDYIDIETLNEWIEAAFKAGQQSRVWRPIDEEAKKLDWALVFQPFKTIDEGGLITKSHWGVGAWQGIDPDLAVTHYMIIHPPQGGRGMSAPDKIWHITGEAFDSFTSYTRTDLFNAQQAKIERLREALEKMRSIQLPKDWRDQSGCIVGQDHAYKKAFQTTLALVDAIARQALSNNPKDYDDDT